MSCLTYLLAYRIYERIFIWILNHMYILAIGWLYVVLLAALAEAANANGSVLGGIVTFACYGLMPVGLLLYILGRPARRRRHEQRAAEAATATRASATPDARGHAAGAAEPGRIASVREED